MVGVRMYAALLGGMVVEGLSEEDGDLNRDWTKAREQVIQIPGGRMFQVESEWQV